MANKLKRSITESDLDYFVINLNSNLNFLNEHLVCNCCFGILNNPSKILDFFIFRGNFLKIYLFQVTLLCGHSFCQICFQVLSPTGQP